MKYQVNLKKIDKVLKFLLTVHVHVIVSDSLHLSTSFGNNNRFIVLTFFLSCTHENVAAGKCVFYHIFFLLEKY